MDIKEKLNKYLEDNLPVKRESFAFFGATAKQSVAKHRCNYEACASTAMLDEEVAADLDINTFLDKELNENKFQKLLFEYIDARGLKDSDVYNKANIDRRLFSKIRSDDNYHPSKETIIALATGLELNIDELEDLLDSASYSLPKNNKFDLIIRFCFLEKIYNLIDINMLLNDHGCNTI